MSQEENEGPSLGFIVGVIAAIAGAFYGYSQAELSGQNPFVGAGIFAFLAFGLGRLGVVIVKNVIMLAVYAFVVIVLTFIFRERMITWFGIDPVAFLEQMSN